TLIIFNMRFFSISEEDNNTNGNNFEKENISIDVLFDNCLDESIEDEDSYICEIYLDLLKDFDESSTEYDGIASNMLHKIMIVRIEINIVLSVSNNSSNNKITSLDFGSVNTLLKCKEFFLKKNVSIVSEIKKIVVLLIDSMYSKNNVSYHALNTIYTIVKYYSFDFVFHIDYYFDKITDYLYFEILSSLSISCSDEETESKYSTEISKILEKLDNYSNYKPEYIIYYFLEFSIYIFEYSERLFEYITTEDSYLSPLFEGYSYKMQFNKSFFKNLYFISEANIDLHEISVIKYKVFMTFLSLLCNSNSVSKNSAVLFGMKKRSIQNRKKNHDMEIDVDKCTLGNTQAPHEKKNLTKSYYEIIFFFIILNSINYTISRIENTFVNKKMSSFGTSKNFKKIKIFFLYIDKHNKKTFEKTSFRYNLYDFVNKNELSHCKNFRILTLLHKKSFSYIYDVCSITVTTLAQEFLTKNENISNDRVQKNLDL
uniref:Uncharacterized protein n=1 Tax=Strongyloides stercoralis TaxID=6248 RepID=A0AAF5DJV1_STRER